MDVKAHVVELKARRNFLEKTRDDLNTVLEVLDSAIDTLESGDTRAVQEAASKVAEAPEPEPTSRGRVRGKPAAAPAAKKEEVIPYETVREVLLDTIDKKGHDCILVTLREMGFPSGKDVPPERRGEFLEKLRSAARVQ